MITITKRAADQINESRQQDDNTANLPLRLAAKVSDDGSYHYGLGFDEVRDGDENVESEGINIVVAEESKDLLKGCVLDFVEITEGDKQFIFLNPNDPNYVPPTDGDIALVPPKHGDA
jgi:iron-sulfur cluster assembly protein